MAKARKTTKKEAKESISYLCAVKKMKYGRRLCEKSLHNYMFKQVIINYIENNLKTASLIDLSQKLNYNVTHLSEVITRVTGTNFYKLLKTTRIKKAANLLETSTLSLSAISKLVGYGSESTFITAFKSIFVYTPNEYRKKAMREKLSIQPLPL